MPPVKRLKARFCPTKGRHHVLELGHLDLQLALAGLGMLGENTEDKLGPVQNLAFRDLT